MGLGGYMTKAEYNNCLQRYHKAIEWYHSNPPTDQQEKFLGNFEQILESLRIGCLELKPIDVLGGFK